MWSGGGGMKSRLARIGRAKAEILRKTVEETMSKIKAAALDEKPRAGYDEALRIKKESVGPEHARASLGMTVASTSKI